MAASIEELRARMDRYGEVKTERPGALGRLELLFKSMVRKLVQRHLDQEREVHEALGDVLERLSDVLRAEHTLMDDNAATITEHAARRARDD